jgi:hypothetical protein
MKRKSPLVLKSLPAVFVVGLLLVAQAQTQTSAVSAVKNASPELVGQLTKQLSITPTQAQGGAGSLFSLAKSRLSADEFGKISSVVPGMSGLLKSAPSLKSSSSGLSSMEGMLPGNMGKLAEAYDAFNKLGMSPEMATKFVPVMSKFVESKGGSTTAALLEKALK